MPSTEYRFRLACAIDGAGSPNPADIATAGSTDLFAGPDGFVSGDDFDLFINAFFNELQWPGSTAYVADFVDGNGNPGADGFLTGADYDAFTAAFFQGGCL